jgi:diguanylate cyclase (GGDEF)-like protein
MPAGFTLAVPMRDNAGRMRRVVGRIGMVVALVIAVGAPAGYYLVATHYSLEMLAFKAQLSAGRAAQYIFGHERLWQYQQVRLAELIELPLNGMEPIRQRIIDRSGKVVVQEGGDLALPLQRVRSPVRVGGETVAWLDAETSARPLVVRAAYVAFGSCLLGLVAWFAVRLLPLRLLDRTLAQLAMQTTRFQAALDNMMQGLCMFDTENRLVVHNRRFDEMFGAPDSEASRSGPLADKMLRDRGLGEISAQALASDPDGAGNVLPDGRMILVSRQAIADGGWVATYEDVTERKRTQERLSHMVRHDALTGLPNRVMVAEHMERLMPRVRRGHHFAVLCLDLDGFKQVNDTLGHAAGDALLRQAAHRLRENTRETNMVARLGGDEFAVIQDDADQPADAAALAARLVQALEQPFEINGHRLTIGTSIGVMVTDEAADPPEELMRCADIALYRAKAGGRGTWRFFEPGMSADILHGHALGSDLRVALVLRQFEIYYQPLIDVKTGTLIGFEALLRWHHPTHGMVPPGEFIPLAEKIGLIKPIGAWVLAQACADAAGWPEHVKIAVNLSPLQFINGRLVEEVEQALSATGLRASRLELEVTESVLLQENDATMSTLHRLRALGVRISMDDFGTGYSSLSYLQRFPFDKIKIDQSFVQALETEKGSIGIVRAVVGLGRALGMEVLAEGVETAGQLSILKAEGCDELQGYFFSKPRPIQDVQAIISAYATGRRA